jgi:uncharacterized secreted protein with C-terminal beta-propeller domain
MSQLKKTNIGDVLCLFIIIAIALILAACSGGSDQVVVDPVIERPTEPPQINSSTSFEGPLVKAGQQSVSRFLKNGIYSATFDYANVYVEEVAAPVANFDDAKFSTTNTQESGVDEADRIEYDGEFLYVAAYPNWYKEGYSQSSVRVLERQNDFSLNSVADLPLATENANIDGLYQNANRLAVLSTNFEYYAIDILIAEPVPWELSEQKVALDIYDTSVSSSPAVLSKIEVDGAMLSSRRIDDSLYLVTSYTLHVEGLNPNATTEEELLANYLAILDTPDSELMPKIYRDGDEGQAMNSTQDCVIPAQATENDGYANLLTITRISLSDPNDVQSSCISSVAGMLYMSEANLYLSSSYNNQTILHKVALDENLTYQATGNIDGVIGWRGAPNLRLSEKDNNLRIVTSDYTAGEPEHTLYVLAQQGNELTSLATLPNEANPEPIGKPGEDIYAVRFIGDRGYIVTFERIDPLYVIDLANPNEPSVLGALEIPGFSSYLHPIGDNYLLGVGQQINTNNRPETGEQVTETLIEEGMKVSLFDVSDPSAPVEVNSIIKPNSYTPVEYDYRALSVLSENGNYRFAMPIEGWELADDSFSSYWNSVSSLLMFEVDTTAQTPELVLRNELTPDNNDEFYIYGGNDRSVIHGDNVYYIHGNQVWQSTWAEGAEIFGPF